MASIRLETWPLSRLRPYANNAKKHPPSQVVRIAKSIQAYGFNDPIAVTAEGDIIEGHGRLLAATDIGLAEVQVLVLEGMTEAQVKRYRIWHNKLTHATGFDRSALGAQLRGLLGAEEPIDLDTLGFTQSAADGFLRAEQERLQATNTGQAEHVTREPVRPIETFEIVFGSREQQLNWQRFKRRLKDESNADHTDAQRVLAQVRGSGIMQPVAVRTRVRRREVVS